MQISTLVSDENSRQRKVILRALLENGSVLVEAIDGLKPAQFSVHGTQFPWGNYLPKIYRAWYLSNPVPAHFKPLKRIPNPVIEQLEKATQVEQMQILKALRQADFLPRIRG